MGEQRLIQIVVFRPMRPPSEHLLQIDASALSFALPSLAIGVNDVADIGPQVWMEDLGASINLLPEYVPRFIETMAHADVVISDTGKQENHRPFCGFVFHPGENPLRVLLGQRHHGILSARTDEGSSVRKHTASDTQGVGHVVHVYGIVAFQEIAQAVSGMVERRCRPRREYQQVRWIDTGAWRRLGCFLEHDVRVRPSHASGHNSRSSGAIACPFSQLRVDVERSALEIDFRIGLAKVETGWQAAMLEGKDGFYD